MRSLFITPIPHATLKQFSELLLSHNNIFPISEVARTRLRESGTKYTSFWQTLRIVYREEGRRGLYRGLATQLVRQIPNSAIMMGTFELTEELLRQWTARGRPIHGPQSRNLASMQEDLKDAAKDSCPATPVRS